MKTVLLLRWFWRSKRRWVDSASTFPSLPYPTWESVLVPGARKPILKAGENMAGKRGWVCATCWVDSGYTEETNRLTLDAPNSKNLSLCSKDHKDMPHCCSDISTCHFYSHPPKANFVTWLSYFWSKMNRYSYLCRFPFTLQWHF